jgi:hypothetical protein
MRTTPGIPRHLGLLDDGPWLRDRTAVHICGWIWLVAVGVVIGALVLGEWTAPDPRSSLAALLFVALILGAFVAVCGPLAMLGVWIQGRSVQYCPDCLKYMTRGARVCPYCGLRKEQEPAAGTAAPPFRRPRRSA